MFLVFVGEYLVRLMTFSSTVYVTLFHSPTPSALFFQTAIAEQQRDEALSHVKALTEKLEQMKMSGNNGCPPNYRPCDLRGMPLAKLKSIQVAIAVSGNAAEQAVLLYHFLH